MMTWWKACVVLCVTAVLFDASCGRYIITTQNEWPEGGQGHICVDVDDPAAPAGYLTLSANKTYYSYDEDDVVTLPEITFPIPPGTVNFCQRVDVPHKKHYTASMWMRGQVAGEYVNRTMTVHFQMWTRKTFIQTDKYLYKPGQKVQIRLLSMFLTNLTVSTRQYPMVWVTTPSNTRIAQWDNVDNSDGLVHLEMMLADEPQQGEYSIHAKDIGGETHKNYFKVQEYVVPRFEVTVDAPKAFLSTADTYLVRLCARYTYGQPVKGNFTVQIDNSRMRDCFVARNFTGVLNGCHDVEVTSASLRVIDCDVFSVAVRALVSEAGTLVTKKGGAIVRVTRKAFTFTKIHQDYAKKPGLPYTLMVRVDGHDGTPAVGELLEVCTGDACTKITVPRDGIITVNPRKDQYKTIRMKALTTRLALEESSFYTDIDRYYSPSNSALLIYLPPFKLKCTAVNGGEAEYIIPVFFVSDQRKATFTVQVLSKYTLQLYTKTEEFDLVPGDLPIDSQKEPLEDPPVGTFRGMVNIPLTLKEYILYPAAKIIVWMVRPDGEVVSDAKIIQMEKCLTNKAELGWSEESVEPGRQVEMKLTSAPHSLCSLGVVDKGALLLDTRTNLLTIDNFFRPLQLSRPRKTYFSDADYCKHKLGLYDEYGYGYFTRYDDASLILNRFGLHVVSDLLVETRPCEKTDRGIEHHFPGMGGGHYAMHVGYAASSENRRVMSETKTKKRTHFPETWLWDLYVIPASGVHSERVTIPDTITDWVGQAVCVNPQNGLGLSTLSNITTFTPFFLDLTLPPSIKRGETLGVLVSIFNYMKTSLPVLVEVHDSPEYEIVKDPSSERPEGVMEACVPGNSKVVLEVKIKPTTLGQVNITVEARVDYSSDNECGVSVRPEITKRDALVKPITVKAEGFPREKTWNKYICAKELSDGSDVLEKWDVRAPEGIVEGSDRGWVTVVGSLLTVSLENLGHLIRMPYGCGEQNMVNFAPNVFILQYLTITNQATPEATAKLTRLMNTGYQRQLLYLRTDGSYSAFGDADPIGSTWLTAFVVKCLAQAQPFITIDQGSLNRSINWLIERQGRNGCFIHLGQLFNKALQGGLRSSEGLTAYVLIALLEAGTERTNPTVIDATSCILSARIPTDHPYTLALKAYALALAGTVEAQEVLESLMSQAVVTSNSTHWESLRGDTRGNALLVETAGYAILAMITLDSQAYQDQVRKVVKWITVQRNGQGGFYSTQDTVVALQALAKYESTQHQGGVDFVATVKGKGINHSFAVTEVNKLVTQAASLGSLPTTLTLSMLGHGCAVIQSVLRYNAQQPKSSDAFTLNIETFTAVDRMCSTKWINVCFTYELVHHTLGPPGSYFNDSLIFVLSSTSNMVVVSVDLVSGYAPIKDDLKHITRSDQPVFKRYEVDGSEVNFYLEEMPVGRVECLKMRMTRLVEVEGTKPGSVTIYDYYQPELSVSKIYTLPPSDECIYSP